MNDNVKLTRELIEMLRTNGAFTTATITALGLKWNGLRKGWVDDLIGTEITRKAWIDAVDGVGKYAKEFRQEKQLERKELKRSGGTPELPVITPVQQPASHPALYLQALLLR